MAQYRKKPVVIEALRYTGENRKEILEFAPRATEVTANPGSPTCPDSAYHATHHYCPSCSFVSKFAPGLGVRINTLEGVMTASPGDFIIKGVKGEFYPCKPDVFEKSYEEVL